MGSKEVVVEAYGSGTGPAEIRTCLEDLARGGMFVVVTTEVVRGEVAMGTYETDLVTANGLLILGGRMLAEAALAKLSYFLGTANRNNPTQWRGWVVKMMLKSVRGER